MLNQILKLSKSSQKDYRQKLLNRITVIIFLVGINLPLLGAIFKIDPIPVYNRQSPFPEKPDTLMDILRLPGRFKTYYNDNFGFRGSLIHLHGQLMFNFFKVSPSSEVVLGKNGWLFFNSQKTIDYWRNLYPFDIEELNAWKTMLEARHQFCAELGIPYIFMIAPNKHTIYGNKIPDRFQPQNNYSRLDQLITYLKVTDSPVEIIDLRSSLKEVSKNYRTYHRTDTHWNFLGSYVGYSELARKLNQEGVSVNQPSLEKLRLKQETVLGGDLARMMGLKHSISEERILIFHNKNQELVYLIMLSLVIILSFLLYRLIELPAINIGKSISNKQA